LAIKDSYCCTNARAFLALIAPPGDTDCATWRASFFRTRGYPARTNYPIFNRQVTESLGYEKLSTRRGPVVRMPRELRHRSRSTASLHGGAPPLSLSVGAAFFTGLCSLAVHLSFGHRGQFFVGRLFLIKRLIEEGDHIFMAKLLRPRYQGAVTGHLVVFDGLGC
jgi:hypothetical protein